MAVVYRFKTRRAGVTAMLSLALLSGCSPSAPKPKSEAEVQLQQQERTKWRSATLSGAYEQVGRKNPKWDEDAKAALETFATLELNEVGEEQKDLRRIARYTESAINQGCDDPLVRYLYLRYAYDRSAHPTNEIIAANVKMAEELAASAYPEMRKLMGCLRASENIKRLDQNSPDMYRLRRDAIGRVANVLADKELPPAEALGLCWALLDDVRVNAEDFPKAYQAMEGPLMKNFGQTAVPYDVKGFYYLEDAWNARGHGTADTVSKEKWKLFAERLNTAQAAFEKAWKMDPTDPVAPTQMIRIELGQGQGRERMELWFQIAMAANTNNIAACRYKMLYLLPQWYGSWEEMISFGRECVTNQAWGGHVTSFLVDVHQEIANRSRGRTNYWSQPGVWDDVHRAFAEFFRRNPEAVDEHANYLWYAMTCQDWDVVNEQIPLLGEPINYDYFGGREIFEANRKYALENGKPAAAAKK